MSKAAKSILFTAQSSANDISVKVKNVMKWLKAGHEVRVSITGNPDRRKSMEAIVVQLQTNIKSGAKFVQQTSKQEKIFYVLRPTEDAAKMNIENTFGNKLSRGQDPLELITSDKDIFSDEFEKELERSIKEERNKNKKS